MRMNNYNENQLTISVYAVFSDLVFSDDMLSWWWIPIWSKHWRCKHENHNKTSDQHVFNQFSLFSFKTNNNQASDKLWQISNVVALLERVDYESVNPE